MLSSSFVPSIFHRSFVHSVGCSFVRWYSCSVHFSATYILLHMCIGICERSSTVQSPLRCNSFFGVSVHITVVVSLCWRALFNVDFGNELFTGVFNNTHMLCCVTRVVVSNSTHGNLNNFYQDSLALIIALRLSVYWFVYVAQCIHCSALLCFQPPEQESFELMLWHFILCMCKRFHRSHVPGVLFISSKSHRKCHGKQELPLAVWSMALILHYRMKCFTLFDFHIMFECNWKQEDWDACFDYLLDYCCYLPFVEWKMCWNAIWLRKPQQNKISPIVIKHIFILNRHSVRLNGSLWKS